MSIRLKKLISWIILIGWMIFIFYMSNQPADVSNGQSDFVLNLVESLGFNISASYVDIAITIIRKGAHFTEYLILNLLYFNMLRFYISNKKALIYSIILSFIYASTDEFHQRFVEGRAGKFTDVLIDTSGAATGSIIAFIIIKIKEIKKAKVFH
ncbi:VanZ family protein [Clostridium sardiniense]|uniref:VanZ family protein n=1 Tax=Clostridium sardiniense TaxID=29369 RepID=A0ABS7L2P2_CLOSR|nr:VanZ family protein [Clostridium sardiniense]MBY0757329.1 VanZ family protein [Clostridium sardiniense]MDQ0461741.1 VanZ family protein [Clostridium sardiniense]